MKTFTKAVEQNRLVIERDCYPETPRSWDTLGHFINIDSNFLVDADTSTDYIGYIEYFIDHNNNATTKDVINYLKDNFEDIEEVYTFSWRNYSSASPAIYNTHVHTGNDDKLYSDAFYIVEKDNDFRAENKDFEHIIVAEIEVYQKYLDGEVYSFQLLDSNGSIQDSCSGFYSMNDIKEHLPKEWENEDMERYLVD